MSRVPAFFLTCCLLLSPLTAQTDPVGIILTPSQTLDLGTCATYTAASTNDEEVGGWFWNLGDGRLDEGREIKVEYNTPGVYKLTLQITRPDGSAITRLFSRWVFVNDPALYRDYQIPLSFIESPEQEDVFEVGADVTFVGVGFDEDEDEYEEDEDGEDDGDDSDDSDDSDDGDDDSDDSDDDDGDGDDSGDGDDDDGNSDDGNDGVDGSDDNDSDDSDDDDSDDSDDGEDDEDFPDDSDDSDDDDDDFPDGDEDEDDSDDSDQDDIQLKTVRRLATGITLYWDFDDGTLLETTTEEITKAYDSPCLKNAGFCAYEVRLFSRDSKGLATVDPAVSLIAVSEDLAAVPDGVILSPVLEADPEETFEFEALHFELRGETELVLVGGVEGVEDLTGYSAFWTAHDYHEVFDNGNQEALATYEGFEIGPFTADDFADTGVRDLVFFLFVVSPQGVTDPIPDHLEVEVGNATPEGVLIVEPSFDIPLHLSDRIDLVGEAEDLEDSELDYVWKIRRMDDDTEVDCFEGPYIPNVGFPQIGLYRISMQAFDRSGGVTDAPIARYVIVYPEFEDLINQETGDLYYPPLVDLVDPEEYQVLNPRRTRITFSTKPNVDNERPITNYFWDLAGQISTDERPAAVSFNNPGYNFVRCFVRDGMGLWSPEPAFWNVFVFTNNIPPRAQITSPPLRQHEDDDEYFEHLLAVKINEPIVLKGTADDVDGDFPLLPLWLVDGEPQYDRTTFEESFLFEEAGLYAIRLLTVDNDGEGDPFGDFRLIQVVDPAAKPRAYIVEPAGDIVVEPGEPVFFAGFAEDPNDLDLSFQWDFGNATAPDVTDMEYVYPVVFDQESPDGEPYVVRLTVTSECAECVSETIPAEVRVTVKRFNDSDLEPNNNFDEAKSLQQGSYGNLSLDPAAGDNADYFRFDVEEDEKDLSLNLRVEEQGVPLTLKLYRLEDAGWTLIEAGQLDAGSESVALEAVPRGSYAVEILVTEEGAKRRMGLNYGISLSTLQPSLFLPLLVEDGRLSSMVGIINATASDADMVITGLDEQGKSVTTQSRVLKANARMFVSSENLFGRVGNKARARDIHWVRIQSTVRLLGYTNAETPDKSQLMSVAAVKSLSSQMVVPHIATKTDQWYTRAVMVNADEGAHPVDFDAAGATVEIRNKVNADNQLDFRFTEVYTENLPEWGTFKNRNKKASLAGYELFGRVDGFQNVAGLQMIDLNIKNPNFVRINKNIYFTHIAKDPTAFWTGIALINTGSSDAFYNLVGFNDSGQEVVRSNAQTLAVGGKITQTTQQMFPDATDLAWLMVETNSEMAGFELFGDPGGERMAGFQAAESMTDTLYFPHIQVDSNPTTGEPVNWTGIALLNIDTQPVNIEVRGYSDSGELVAESTETLQPGTKLVRTAQAVFPGGLPANTGYIRVKADRRVLSGFELFGSLATPTKLGRQLAGLPALRK